MGFFTKMFASVKNTIVASVVETEVNKLEKKLNDSIEPMTVIFNKIFGLYGTACNKVMVATAKGVTDNKTEVIALVSENADILQKIANLVKQLDTERNRHLLGEIGKSWINIVKDVNTQMEKEFEEDFPTNIKPACDAVDAIWDIKPTTRTRKKKITDFANETIDIAKIVGLGHKVMMRQIGTKEHHTIELYIDHDLVDTCGKSFSYTNEDIWETMEVAGGITDFYFYNQMTSK